MVYSLGGQSARPRVWGSWVQNPKACTWSRRPNFVRKGGFLVVERVLRPYRWPRHCWALNLQKQKRACWNATLLNVTIISSFFLQKSPYIVVFAGLRLNNAWANGTVLRPFLQPESPLSSRSLVSGFKCKLRDSNSRPPYSRPHALSTRLYTIHVIPCISAPNPHDNYAHATKKPLENQFDPNKFL